MVQSMLHHPFSFIKLPKEIVYSTLSRLIFTRASTAEAAFAAT